MKFILKFFGVVAGILLVLGFAANYSSTHSTMKESLHSYAADSLIDDYNFLERNNGKWMDRCVRAEAIVQAYISAHDDDNFQKWTAIKKHDCAKAGL